MVSKVVGTNENERSLLLALLVNNNSRRGVEVLTSLTLQ